MTNLSLITKLSSSVLTILIFYIHLDNVLGANAIKLPNAKLQTTCAPCAIRCASGFVLDQTSCPCKCVPILPVSPCSLVLCVPPLLPVVVSETCRCLPNKLPKCPCTLLCIKGFVQDTTVCPCRCVPQNTRHPCSAIRCGPKDIPKLVANIPNGCKCVPNNPSTRVLDGCPIDKPRVFCFLSPCLLATCPANPKAVCVDNFCGGCNAEFFVGTTRINCDNKSSKG